MSIAVVLAFGLTACAPSPMSSGGADQAVDEASRPVVTEEALLAEAEACPGIDPHPIAAGIADFEVYYDQVVEWFCGGATFEDILLALQTERLTSIEVEELLAARAQGLSWEAIWNRLGITAP